MIIEQEVTVKWNGQNKNHYISKGYQFTEIGRELLVNTKDLPVSPYNLIPFICDYCNGENQTDGNSRYKSSSNYYKQRKITNKDCCSNAICRNNKRKESFILNLKKDNKTLADLHPQIVTEWSYKNIHSPFNYSPSSGQVVIWECNKGHEWKSSICNRTNGNRGCPYCAGKKTNSENSLATTHPELSEEWNFKKNGDLSPDDTSKGSNRKVWWIGKCGHEWDDFIYHRTKGVGCPYCASKRVDIKNNLFSTNPSLVKEWDHEKNDFSPFDVHPNSNKKAWWICSKCTHTWESMIANRNKGVGCPVCSESKGERKIRHWLERNGIEFEAQKEFVGLVGIGGGMLSFDFYLPDKNLLIEYQGEFHDGSKGDFTKINLNKQKIHDDQKKIFATNNKIKLLEVWYWDFNIIENILQKELNIIRG